MLYTHTTRNDSCGMRTGNEANPIKDLVMRLRLCCCDNYVPRLALRGSRIGSQGYMRCDQSFFLFTGAISAPGSALFGPGVGPIWLDNVQCNGTEERLEECGYNGWGNTPCYHSSDASVVCESKHS